MIKTLNNSRKLTFLIKIINIIDRRKVIAIKKLPNFVNSENKISKIL